jgi:hypothetical protein
MKSNKMILALTGIGALVLTTSFLTASTPASISVQGACHQRVPIGTQRTEVESIDLNRLFALGINTAQRALAKTAELIESAPKREVEGSMNLTVKDSDRDTPNQDIRVPFRLAIPKLSSMDMEAFANDIVGDPSEFENLVKTRTRLGIDEKVFERYYEACMKDALADAKAKAAAEAERRGVALGEMTSANANTDISAESETSRQADLRITLDVSFSTL